MSKPSCYIAGPMRGIDRFNFPAFDDAAYYLRDDGWDVRSPADHDREQGFDESLNSLDGFDLGAALLWDLQQVAEVDCVVLLPGWSKSSGVALELHMAKVVGKEVVYYDKSRPWGFRLVDKPLIGDLVEAKAVEVHSAPQQAEVRITDAKTGGQKGQKLPQLGAIDPAALLALAEVAGFGGQKYERYNYLKGYDWSLSFDAAMRHALAFWNGEDFDAESSLPHAAHFAWHALALLSFLIRDLGTDDRPLIGATNG